MGPRPRCKVGSLTPITETFLASGTEKLLGIGAALVGLAVSFGTKEETYKEQKRIKVAWIGSRKAPSDERGIGFAVAAMLGGEASESKPATKKVEPPLTDDDIPF